MSHDQPGHGAMMGYPLPPRRKCLCCPAYCPIGPGPPAWPSCSGEWFVLPRPAGPISPGNWPLLWGRLFLLGQARAGPGRVCARAHVLNRRGSPHAARGRKPMQVPLRATPLPRPQYTKHKSMGEREKARCPVWGVFFVIDMGQTRGGARWDSSSRRQCPPPLPNVVRLFARRGLQKTPPFF